MVARDTINQFWYELDTLKTFLTGRCYTYELSYQFWLSCCCIKDHGWGYAGYTLTPGEGGYTLSMLLCTPAMHH